jgi:hypothetical protein
MVVPLVHIQITPSEGHKDFDDWFLKKLDHENWTIKSDHGKGHLPWHYHIPKWLNRNSPPPWAMCWSLSFSLQPRMMWKVTLIDSAHFNERGHLTTSYRWTNSVWQNNRFVLKTFRKITDHFHRQVYGLYLNLIKENRKIITHNQSDLETQGLGFSPIVPKNLSAHWLSSESSIETVGRKNKYNHILIVLRPVFTISIISFKGLGLVVFL